MIFRRRKYKLDNGDKIKDLYLILFSFIFLSYSFFFCFIGAFLNMGVMINNGGKMPVLSDCNFSTYKHFSFQNFEEVKYPYLADIIEIKNPINKKSGMASLGDMMMFFSFFLAVFTLTFFTIKAVKSEKAIRIKYDRQFKSGDGYG